MNDVNMEVKGSERATVNLWPDAARILGLGRNSIYKGAASGEIPVVRVGKRLLVPRVALQRLLESAGTPRRASV